MILRRLSVPLLLAVAAVVITAGPAFAHAELIASTPAKGATLQAAPTQIQLTFNEAVTPESITVTGPDGAQWTVGQAAVAGAGVITAPVQPTGPAGPYALAYRVRSADGDPVSGTVNFSMAVAATTTTTTTTTTATTTTAAAQSPSPAPAAQGTGSDGGGVPAWVWIVAAAAIVVITGGGILLTGRRRGKAPS